MNGRHRYIFSAKILVHVGTVFAQRPGHASSPAECGGPDFYTQKKHIGIGLQHPALFNVSK